MVVFFLKVFYNVRNYKVFERGNAMSNQLFTNEIIISWLQYFAKYAVIDLEKVKMLDITRGNKNLIPTIQSHQAVLVFTEAGDHDIFYRMWNVGLGDCEVWYNEGSEPVGEMKHDKLCDMIDRGINANAGMLIVNPNAVNSSKIGMDNSNFIRGSIPLVASEIRAVILNKMRVGLQDNIVVITGESIAIESAIIASEGKIIAVEYNKRDRRTLEQNMEKFGLYNIYIEDDLDEEAFKKYPVPSMAFVAASDKLDQEIEFLTKLNPQIELIVYTLDFTEGASLKGIFESHGLKDVEVIQITVSKLSDKNYFEQEPAPWIVTGRAEEVVPESDEDEIDITERDFSAYDDMMLV